MPWQCRLIEGPQTRFDAGEELRVGDMWLVPAMVEGEHAQYYLDHLFSDDYKRDWLGKRPPIVVVLPDRTWFNVDQRASDGNGPGWTVIGEAPNLTLSPSINMVGHYHGWLQNGVISDDVDGRIFPS